LTSDRLSWIRSKCKVEEKILDIGSASGFVFRGTELESYVTFVDLDKYDMPNFFQMDAHHLTFIDQAFDVAILGELLEHVEDPVQVLREANRVAKRLVITVPDEANWNEKLHPYSSVQDLIKNENVSGMKELAEKANPEVVKFYEDNYHHCFHNRFYSEESLRNELEKAGIFDYDLKRLQYSGWSFFTVEALKLTSKLPANIPTKELEAQFDRDYFSWNGIGQAKGYRGHYADFPENIKFADYIKNLNPESVLEVGCAYGFLVKRLNDAEIPTKGCDVSSFAYKMRVTNDTQIASVLALPYKDKEFDLVVTIELLEHIKPVDIEQALKELARVSRRGVFWIAYKEVDDLFQTKDITHINIMPYQWWVDKVKEICGSEYNVVYKETDWYSTPVMIPVGGSKKGLNVGSFTSMLNNTSDTVWTNIDILNLHEYAKAYSYNFTQCDAKGRLPFPDSNFDYIVASHFLEHLDRNEGLSFLKECRRILKPLGLIRVAVPDTELLIRKYKEGSLGYFDETNPECEKAETQLDKLYTLLFSNHKDVYDEGTLKIVLEKSGFNAKRRVFNESTIPNIFDYHPDLSLYMEAMPVKEVTLIKTVTSACSSKLKIALISTPYMTTPPEFYGGLERVVADLAAALGELGHDVTLFATKGSKPIGNYKVIETIEPLPDFSTGWNNFDWFELEKKMYDAYKSYLKDFDIIHGHNWFCFEYIAKMSNSSLAVCHTHHGGWNVKTKPPNINYMNLIAISEWMSKVYTGQGFAARYVYNGVNLKDYPFSLDHGDRLVYVGRFTSFKQPHVAIAVAKKLGLGLDLIGGASEKDYFEKQVKPYCDGEKIKLHWKASHLDKVKLLQNAKALIFPSRMGEPYGLVAVEAMSCGCPVLTLNDGAIPEVVKEGGIVLNIYNFTSTPAGIVMSDKPNVDVTASLVESIKNIDSIKPLDCRKNAERFSRKIMGERYLELYDSIIKGKEW